MNNDATLRDSRNWEYVTIQGGCEFWRTGFEANGWPVFAKQLRGKWRAFEACHRALRFRGIYVDGRTRDELAQRLFVMFNPPELADAS